MLLKKNTNGEMFVYVHVSENGCNYMKRICISGIIGILYMLFMY